MVMALATVDLQNNPNTKNMTQDGEVLTPVQAADQAIRQTQFDYSQTNRPDWMKKNAFLKAITMFKMYPLGVYQLLGESMSKLTSKDQKAEGAKLLAGITMSHSLAAGVAGGVLMEPIRMLLWAFTAGWDDEDIDTQIRGALADTGMSPKSVDVVLHGLPGLVGINLSPRLGLNNLLSGRWGYVRDGMMTEHLLMQAGGPAASILKGMERGVGYLAEGEYAKAMSAMLPMAAARQVSKAWGMASSGLTDSQGRKIVEPEDIGAWDIGTASLGLVSRQLSNTYEARSATMKYEQYWQDEAQEITEEFRKAKTPEARLKARVKLREHNKSAPPTMRTGKGLTRSIKRGIEREKLTRSGVYTTDPSSRKRLERYDTLDD
jgi:hypothetical protein